MQSSNPVFARSEQFNGRASRAPSAGYTDPSTWQIARPGQTAPGQGGGYGPPAPTGGGGSGSGGGPAPATTGARMTIDSVVQKTAITLALVFAAAAVTWFAIGEISSASPENLNKAYMFAFGGAIVGFGLAMVNSFKKVISPALVIAYALVEGAFVGAFSKVIVAFVGGDAGIVSQAVLGTAAAFVGTLAAYKFFNIKVTDKFRKGVTAAMFGFVGLILVNFVLNMFGVNMGLRDFSLLGLLVSVVAVCLGVLMLILDFDFVERGVAAGIPERESWRAAFGLTVTLIWLYIEILRILAILRGD